MQEVDLKLHKLDISKTFNIGLLLLPGFIYAILSLLVSGQILPYTIKSDNLFILNIAQLLSFGVTIAKYAADQMLLAKLSPNESAVLSSFFVKRVFPLSIVYVLFLFFTHTLDTILCLLFCIPIEVYIIIVVLELNLSKKFFKAAILSLIGYPLVFLTYIIYSFFTKVDSNDILMFFFSAALLKFLIGIIIRGKTQKYKEVLTLSPFVPLQQAGNYVLFKADQLFIAANLIPCFLFRFNLPADYLFYSKFIEIFSGIATSLSPLIVNYAKDKNHSFSAKKIFSNRIYWLFCITALFLQIISTVFLLKNQDALHMFLLIPFLLVTLLIVPVNIVNYELYRINNLKKGNLLNLISFLISALMILSNMYIKSSILFACIIPLQLFTFVVANHLVKTKPNV
jgi:hypothetical protein